jgi:transposase
MLHLSVSCRYYLYHGDTNMRKGFDSLSGIVSSMMQVNILNGDIFIFLNKRRNQIKLLLWEGDGFSLYHKRLEQGTYELPVVTTNEAQVMVSQQQLLLMLQGISLKSVRKRKRYQQQPKTCG